MTKRAIVVLMSLTLSGCFVYHVEGEEPPHSIDLQHRVQTNLVLDRIDVVVRDDVELRVDMRNIHRREALRIEWFAGFEGPLEEAQGLGGTAVTVSTKRPQTGRRGVLEIFPGERKQLEVKVPWRYSGRWQFGISSIEEYEVAEEYTE